MDKQKNNDVKISVPWYGYVVFVLAILLFSGIFSSSDGVLRALDFNVLMVVLDRYQLIRL